MQEWNPEDNNNFLVGEAELYYHTFKEGAGAKVLASLERACNGSNLAVNGICDFQAEITPEQLMFIREGQNQVLRHIKNMMTYYKENRNA